MVLGGGSFLADDGFEDKGWKCLFSLWLPHIVIFEVLKCGVLCNIECCNNKRNAFYGV